MNPLDALPDFQSFAYAQIQPPSAPTLIAWEEARECERRVAWYSWVEANNDHANPQHIVLLNDSLSAFLLSFEAVIQHAKDQAGAFAPGLSLDTWLADQPENDAIFKGLRTLRHLDAHVKGYPVAGHITVTVGASQPSVRRWSLQELQPTDLQKLKHAQLKANDLGAWNSLVQSGNTIDLMARALDRRNKLLLRLEALA